MKHYLCKYNLDNCKEQGNCGLTDYFHFWPKSDIKANRKWLLWVAYYYSNKMTNDIASQMCYWTFCLPDLAKTVSNYRHFLNFQNTKNTKSIGCFPLFSRAKRIYWDIESEHTVCWTTRLQGSFLMTTFREIKLYLQNIHLIKCVSCLRFACIFLN